MQLKTGDKMEKIRLSPETIERNRGAVMLEKPVLILLKQLARHQRRTMGGMVETLIIEEAKKQGLIKNEKQ
jgi:hypothetical protein